MPNQEGSMILKISNWFLNSDEKFLSIVKDENKRKDYLNQLYRFRVVSSFLFFLFLIMALIGIVMKENFLSTTSLLLLIGQVVSYLDTDSRIKAIRFYDLLSMEIKKINT